MRALLDSRVAPAIEPGNAEISAVQAAVVYWGDEDAPAAAARVMPAAAAPSGSDARATFASPTTTPRPWLPSAARAGLGFFSSSSFSSAAGRWRGSGGLPAQELTCLAAASAAAAAAPSHGTLRPLLSVSAPSDLTTSVGALKRKRTGEDEGVGVGDVARVTLHALVMLRVGSTGARDADADSVALCGSSDDVLSSGGAAGAEAADAVAVVVAPCSSAITSAYAAPRGVCCPPTSLVVSSPWHGSGSL